MLLYRQTKTIQKHQIKKMLKSFLKEDAAENDITTLSCIEKTKQGVATLNAREDMIFCGEPIISNIFSEKLKVQQLRIDGDQVRAGEEVAKISGPILEILTKERVLLNLIQRMSGISTLTNTYHQKLKNKDIYILDTRKTTPGLRLLEKYAVYMGGGSNHRFDLSKGVLIKDNHLATMRPDAMKNFQKKTHNTPVQIEIDNIDQITQTNIEMTNGYLLDNMSPIKIKKCIKKINTLNIKKKKIFIEVSGGINLKTLKRYNIEGVNGISVGALTHQATSIDIGLDIK